MTDENAVGAEFVSAALNTFRANKTLCERAVEQVPDELLKRPLHAETNWIAVIMKHIAGNLRARWTQFLSIIVACRGRCGSRRASRSR